MGLEYAGAYASEQPARTDLQPPVTGHTGVVISIPVSYTIDTMLGTVQVNRNRRTQITRECDNQVVILQRQRIDMHKNLIRSAC